VKFYSLTIYKFAVSVEKKWKLTKSFKEEEEEEEGRGGGFFLFFNNKNKAKRFFVGKTKQPNLCLPSFEQRTMGYK